MDSLLDAVRDGNGVAWTCPICGAWYRVGEPEIPLTIEREKIARDYLRQYVQQCHTACPRAENYAI